MAPRVRFFADVFVLITRDDDDDVSDYYFFPLLEKGIRLDLVKSRPGAINNTFYDVIDGDWEIFSGKASLNFVERTERHRGTSGAADKADPPQSGARWWPRPARPACQPGRA